MSQVSCPREAEVFKAVRSGMWEEGLSAHLVNCVDCREIVQASRWMQALAQGSETPTVSDASLLWWSAQLSVRQAKTEKAQEFLDWVELISATVVSAGMAVWVGWNWYAIQSSLNSLFADSWAQFWTLVSPGVNMTPNMLSLSSLILVVVSIVLAYPSLLQD
jgi:hypothetical protein